MNPRPLVLACAMLVEIAASSAVAQTASRSPAPGPADPDRCAALRSEVLSDRNAGDPLNWLTRKPRDYADRAERCLRGAGGSDVAFEYVLAMRRVRTDRAGGVAALERLGRRDHTRAALEAADLMLADKALFDFARISAQLDIAQRGGLDVARRRSIAGELKPAYDAMDANCRDQLKLREQILVAQARVDRSAADLSKHIGAPPPSADTRDPLSTMHPRCQAMANAAQIAREAAPVPSFQTAIPTAQAGLAAATVRFGPALIHLRPQDDLVAPPALEPMVRRVAATPRLSLNVIQRLINKKLTALLPGALQRGEQLGLTENASGVVRIDGDRLFYFRVLAEPGETARGGREMRLVAYETREGIPELQAKLRAPDGGAQLDARTIADLTSIYGASSRESLARLLATTLTAAEQESRYERQLGQARSLQRQLYDNLMRGRPVLN